MQRQKRQEKNNAIFIYKLMQFMMKNARTIELYESFGAMLACGQTRKTSAAAKNTG